MMSTFRTVELSERDANGLQYITVKSENLKGRADISVYIPLGTESIQKLPMVILLHGVYGSHWAWAQKGHAHTCLQQLIDDKIVEPMALIMPSDGLWGDGSAYLPHKNQDYEAWIMKDVAQVCYEKFSAFSPLSPLFIAGLSMGGYGALRLGAKYPNRFKAFSGLSSITEFDQINIFSVDAIDTSNIKIDEKNVADIILKNKDKLPPFRFDCGKQDELFEANVNLSNILSDHQIPHIFERLEGSHTWEYWAVNIKKSFEFFSKNL